MGLVTGGSFSNHRNAGIHLLFFSAFSAVKLTKLPKACEE